MDSNRALVVQPQLTPTTWGMIEAVSPAMHGAHLFGVASVDQAKAIMLKGYELGFGLTTSFEFVQIVQGRPTLSPRGMLALVHKTGIAQVKLQRLEKDGAFVGYECWMKRRDSGFEHTERFTLEDAQRAKLVKSGGAWETYPENMCKWRALGFCAAVVIPDVTGGMYSPEELGATVDDQGNVVEATWTVSAPTAAPQPAPARPLYAEQAPVAPAIDLDALVQKYGAEQVLIAGDGKLPGTDAEIAEIAAKLEAGNGQQ